MTPSRLLLVLLAIALAAVGFSCMSACTGDDDDDDADDAPEDDDDADDDDSSDDDDDDDDDDETFPPEEQEPLFARGLILAPGSLECVPEDTGVPQTNCNHHGSTVAELPDGTVAAVWYHGVAEKSPDARIVWSRLAPGASEWTWPEVLYDDPGRSEGNPALWVAEDDTLFVFFVTIFGDSWNEAHVRLTRSTDGGDTWAAPVTLRSENCWMTRNRPLRLDSGELLLPLYNECLAIPTFMRSVDDFATWSENPPSDLSYLLAHTGQIQPALIGLDGGRIAAITRDGLPTQRVKRMTSDDGGYTWTQSLALDLPNSGTAVDQVRLLDGHVVVVFNDDPAERFPLTAALSRDGGETFVCQRDLDDECDGDSCSFAYPSVMQSRVDGTIWVTYSHEREAIAWVHFNEAWLLDQ